MKKIGIVIGIIALFIYKFMLSESVLDKSNVREKLINKEVRFEPAVKQKITNRIIVDLDKDDLVDWLKNHGVDPDFWHVLVTNSDPDGMSAVYQWIVNQPECDAGTAAQIFHFSAAYEALEMKPENYSSHNRHKMYSNAKKAADRWAQNEFKTHRFTPNDIESSTTKEEFHRLEREAKMKFGKAPFTISNGLFDISKREEPQTDYYYSDF